MNDLNEGIAVVALVRYDRLRFERLNQRRPLRDVIDISCGQNASHRITQSIYAGVNLGGQTAARAADRLIAIVFLGAPDAC